MPVLCKTVEFPLQLTLKCRDKCVAKSKINSDHSCKKTKHQRRETLVWDFSDSLYIMWFLLLLLLFVINTSLHSSRREGFNWSLENVFWQSLKRNPRSPLDKRNTPHKHGPHTYSRASWTKYVGSSSLHLPVLNVKTVWNRGGHSDRLLWGSLVNSYWTPPPLPPRLIQPAHPLYSSESRP